MECGKLFFEDVYSTSFMLFEITHMKSNDTITL